MCNSGRLEPVRQLKRGSWPTTSWRMASPRRSWHSRMSFSQWQSNLALNAQCCARSLVLSPAGSSEGQGGALKRKPPGRKKGFRMVPEHTVIEAMNSENLYWEKGCDLRKDCPRKHSQGTLKTAAKAIAARSICKKRADTGATYNCMRRRLKELGCKNKFERGWAVWPLPAIQAC